MKVLVMCLTALLVSGCGTFHTMEELEHQAMLTGDWSAVEKRERIIARRKSRSGGGCPVGQVAVCDGMSSLGRCTCVESDNLREILTIH